MKTLEALYVQHNRIYNRLTERARKRAKAAHPETGGEPLLVHNWGNETAKAAWAQMSETAAKVQKAYDRLRDEAEHREHTAKKWFPMWCKECKRERAEKRCRKVAMSNG